MPAYNGSRTILSTLNSLASQDYPQIEWVIVDDGSQDGTDEVVRTFLQTHHLHSELVRHERNEGLSRTLNDGLRRSTGEYVLIVHQDVELQGADWISRAVRYISAGERIEVVTCYYGIPASLEMDFVKRAFGFLRRQFHRLPHVEREFVTFTEFKSDLIRKATLERYGGFSTMYRICGEDIMLSYQIRRDGGRILKAYDLHTVQRFTGDAESVRGNLRKEFRFGECITGVLIAFRTYSFRDLKSSSYARTRALHRASQPLVALAAVVLLLLAIYPGLTIAAPLLGLLVLGRYLYYEIRLWPEFSLAVPDRPRAIVETMGAGLLGLASDVAYPSGVLAGLVRSAIGAPL